MRRIVSFFLCVCTFGIIFAQNTLRTCQRSETYLTLSLATKEEVNTLARNFSVDKVTYDEKSGAYHIRLWLAQREYATFESLNIPYELIEPERPPYSNDMAASVSEMANWDKYPTYDTYLQMMENFQTQFPDICQIDTIMEETPDGHAILVAHISHDLAHSNEKPAFWYSSTIHGDEPVGFYMMLHLIDYILNHQSEAIIQEILQNVDLWITPLENPDGTYHSSDNLIRTYYSTRANANGYDMNRNYPGPTVETRVTIQPETQAMIAFAQAHHFVMSVNFHGGAELINYPWDTWASSTKSHSDANWFQHVGNRYLSHCHAADASYMTDDGGITEGGDWYVITGSRQDYMTYYEHCREITFEVSTDKIAAGEDLPYYWTNNKEALLNFILECGYGLRGRITDAATGEPIEAKIFITDHDRDNSEVYSHLPSGNYYRPIKAGTYTVNVTAACYEPYTFSVSTFDNFGVVFDVQLTPLTLTPELNDTTILIGESITISTSDGTSLLWYDSDTTETPISEGPSFQTPALYDTTTYWYRAIQSDGDATCQGTQNNVTIFILQEPIDTSATDTTTTDTTLINNYTISNLLAIYPNPTTGTCCIQHTALGEIHISIFDQSGRLVFQQKSNEATTKIDFSSYSKGFYLVKIIENNKQETSFKVIKR